MKNKNDMEWNKEGIMIAEIRKISESYLVKNGNIKIFVTINKKDNRLTIENSTNSINFTFKNSNPETIKQIGELFIEAAKLIDMV